MSRSLFTFVMVGGLLAACGSSDAADPPNRNQPSDRELEGDHPIDGDAGDGGGQASVDAASGGDAGADGGRAPEAPADVKLARAQSLHNAHPSTANVTSLGAGNRKFAFELFQRLASDKPSENLVLSPFSISSALAMTYAGARGETEAQMQKTLHFELAQPELHEAFNATFSALAERGMGTGGARNGPFRLSLNNSVWLQQDLPVEPTFLDTLALSYDAGVYLANFKDAPDAARSAINLWVDQRTEHLIRELLAPGTIKSNTRMVLTNTVYFAAGWQTKFAEEATGPGPFTRLDGSTSSVPMMHATFYMPYATDEKYDAVSLAYEGGKLSFIAILPKSGSYAGVEQSMDAAFFDALRARLMSTYVQLTLPKFEYESASKVAQQLSALGMTAPFVEGVANFRGMSEQPLWISEVIHKAVIKVTEKETVAAAATAVILAGTTSAPPPPPTPVPVAFDRPFVYAIIDEPTGEILFLGRVLGLQER